MKLKITIVDEFGSVKNELGFVSKEDIKTMTELADRLHFKCLSFIDIDGDTYFSEKQIVEIKNELKILETYSEINKEVLNIIKLGAEEVLSDVHLFLKFENAH